MNRKMTCREGVNALMDYVEGVLSAARRQAVATHVAGCIRCRRFARSYAETPRIVRKATACAVPTRVVAALRRRLSRPRS